MHGHWLNNYAVLNERLFEHNLLKLNSLSKKHKWISVGLTLYSWSLCSYQRNIVNCEAYQWRPFIVCVTREITTGFHFDIKTIFPGMVISIMRPSYLYNENIYTARTASLYSTLFFTTRIYTKMRPFDVLFTLCETSLLLFGSLFFGISRYKYN